MPIRRFADELHERFSYLLMSHETKQAIVIDPQRDVGEYLDHAAALEMSIRTVILTRCWDDQECGHIELRDRVNAQICLGAGAQVDYPFEPLADGADITLGEFRLTVVASPGVAPESITIVVRDGSAPVDESLHLLSGDTLLVGEVGRPAPGETTEKQAGRAARLFETLAHLAKLPDTTRVLPSRGASAVDGIVPPVPVQTDLGTQRATNPAFSHATQSEFVTWVVHAMSDSALAAGRDPRRNRRKRKGIDAIVRGGLTAKRPQDLKLMRALGTRVVDVRAPDAFAAGHVPDSVNVPMDARFGHWIGAVCKPTERVAIVGSDAAACRNAAIRFARLGYDQLVAAVDLSATPVPAESACTVPRTEASGALLDGSVTVIDVRTRAEHSAGTLRDAHHIPLEQLAAQATGVRTDRPIVVVSGSGLRSTVGASILRRAGLAEVSDLRGGLSAAADVLGIDTLRRQSGAIARVLV